MAGWSKLVRFSHARPSYLRVMTSVVGTNTRPITGRDGESKPNNSPTRDKQGEPDLPPAPPWEPPSDDEPALPPPWLWPRPSDDAFHAPY